MLLDDLLDLIEALQARIEAYGPQIRQSEALTRSALIDPLLRGLGWDTADPGMVMPEVTMRARGRADYVLFDRGGSPIAVIEAKALGKGVDDETLRQTVSYASLGKERFIILTDGSHWLLYDLLKPGAIEDKQILDTSIAGSPAHESALKLLALWRRNLETGPPVAAIAPVMSMAAGSSPAREVQGAAASLGTKTTVEVKPRRRKTRLPQPVETLESRSTTALVAQDSTATVSLADYEPPRKTPAPSGIRFESDRHWTRIDRWIDILVFVAGRLVADGLLTKDHAPVQFGRTRYVIHTEAVHSDGAPFRSPAKIPRSELVLETYESAKSLRRYARRLLNMFGLPPSTVLLRVAA